MLEGALVGLAGGLAPGLLTNIEGLRLGGPQTELRLASGSATPSAADAEFRLREAMSEAPSARFCRRAMSLTIRRRSDGVLGLVLDDSPWRFRKTCPLASAARFVKNFASSIERLRLMAAENECVVISAAKLTDCLRPTGRPLQYSDLGDATLSSDGCLVMSSRQVSIIRPPLLRDAPDLLRDAPDVWSDVGQAGMMDTRFMDSTSTPY